MSIDAPTGDRTFSTIPSPPARLGIDTVRDGRQSGLMTVGELARRTGLSHKAIRELEGRGLIYSAGRSESNYRLFDQTALWCVGAVGELRSLGLTLAEIQQLHASYLNDPDRPPSAQFARLLDRAHQRISDRIREQQQTLRRIEAFRADNQPNSTKPPISNPPARELDERASPA